MQRNIITYLCGTIGEGRNYFSIPPFNLEGISIEKNVEGKTLILSWAPDIGTVLAVYPHSSFLEVRINTHTFFGHP
jgi:hypothetical protein